MNKKELVSAVAENTGMRKKDVEAVISSVFDTITEELRAEGKVQIVGFGTFEVADRPAREGRNPSSGETVVIAACKSPRFKASRVLKDVVNDKA